MATESAWAATGALAQVDPHALLAKSITFSRPVVFDYVATRAELERRATRLWAALAEGTLRVPPVERHSLAGAAEAHATAGAAGDQRGAGVAGLRLLASGLLPRPARQGSLRRAAVGA